MDEFLSALDDHWLFGTLIVRVVDRRTGKPRAGVTARIGGCADEALGKR